MPWRRRRYMSRLSLDSVEIERPARGRQDFFRQLFILHHTRKCDGPDHRRVGHDGCAPAYRGGGAGRGRAETFYLFFDGLRETRPNLGRGASGFGTEPRHRATVGTIVAMTGTQIARREIRRALRSA